MAQPKSGIFQFFPWLSTSKSITIRSSTLSDVPHIISAFDAAVEWLVKKGLEGQWGSQPLSVARGEVLVEKLQNEVISTNGGKAWTAEVGGVFAGFISAGPVRPGYLQRALAEVVREEPEIFVSVLLTDRKYTGMGIGRTLLDQAKEWAKEQKASFLRLDCWRGPEGKQGLIEFYERYGFKRTKTFEIPPEEHPSAQIWNGQLLEIHL